LPFDYKRFEHVARVSVDSTVLVVKADAPWSTLRDLIEYARANPDRLRIGNSGQYAHTHIVSVGLFDIAGT
jgi:tripartite-type tricarboxylate transporter receptor subunit TctC